MSPPLRVLYANHTATVSGGERSLLALLDALPDAVEPAVACPAGELADAVRERGVRHLALRGTAGSLRLHPIHTPRAVAELVADGASLRGAARRGRADVVHANSVRAGLTAVAARALGGPPVVTHVRDALPRSPVTRATVRAVRAGSAALVANSEYTRARTRALGGGDRIEVVPSPVDLRRFRPGAVPRDEARRALGVADAAFAVGIVAQITPWKGHDVAVRALARAGGADDVLLVAGSTKFVAANTRHDNRAFLRSLEELVRELGLGDRVRFLGERDDVPAVLAALDVLVMPSWEEPLGRSMLEAMATGLPVAATRAGGPAEVIRDGVDGRLLDPRDVEAWAAALRALREDPAGRRRMGEAAAERVRAAYAPQVQAERLLDLYARVS